MAVYNDIHSTKMDNIYQDSDAIKSSVLNILNLKLLSIFGQPSLGANLEQFIFEPMDFITRHQIEETVLSALYSSEPRITDIIVNITEQPEYNKVYIEVYFLIKSINTSEQVTIKLR